MSLVFAGLVGCGEAGGPRVVTRLVLTGLPSSVIAGTPVTYTATAKDASGTTVTDYSGTVHFTSTDPAAELSPFNYTYVVADAGSHTWHMAFNTVGTQTLTVTDVTTTRSPAARRSLSRTSRVARPSRRHGRNRASRLL